MKKLEWIPLYINRIKGSARYRAMQDFQQGWYFNLLLESVDSEMPGYLPSDGQLWRLANARSERFFEQAAGPVLACFKRRQIDGRAWIYNERLLQTYDEQIHKLTRLSTRRKVKIPLISSLDAGLTLLLYQDYPRHEGRKSALAAIEKAINRYTHEKNITGLEATEFIHKAVLEFAQSDAGKDNGLFPEYRPPHPASWFNTERYLDDRKQWYAAKPPSEAKVGQYQPVKVVLLECYSTLCKKRFDPNKEPAALPFCTVLCKAEYTKFRANRKAAVTC